MGCGVPQKAQGRCKSTLVISYKSDIWRMMISEIRDYRYPDHKTYLCRQGPDYLSTPWNRGVYMLQEPSTALTSLHEYHWQRRRRCSWCLWLWSHHKHWYNQGSGHCKSLWTLPERRPASHVETQSCVNLCNKWHTMMFFPLRSRLLPSSPALSFKSEIGGIVAPCWIWACAEREATTEWAAFADAVKREAIFVNDVDGGRESAVTLFSQCVTSFPGYLIKRNIVLPQYRLFEGKGATSG